MSGGAMEATTQSNEADMDSTTDVLTGGVEIARPACRTHD